ncbi:hypothetical protein [Agrobacterium tumefaciens]|uniref:hypothetical protein n=1 Tax=Agrobacterium tumefaciens TaxID=358 RepID=UPI0015720DB7|nr:nuclear transport factor 2 family protein [Agrobacterium tumefaciens]
MSNIDLKEFYDRYIAGLNARDFDTVAKLIADDVRVNGPAYKRKDVSVARGHRRRGAGLPLDGSGPFHGP